MQNITNFGHTASEEMSFEIVTTDGRRRTIDGRLADAGSWPSYKLNFEPSAQVSLKVQVGKDQEKVQSEKVSHCKNRGRKKNKLTIRYLYHENIS